MIMINYCLGILNKSPNKSIKKQSISIRRQQINKSSKMQPSVQQVFTKIEGLINSLKQSQSQKQIHQVFTENRRKDNSYISNPNNISNNQISKYFNNAQYQNQKDKTTQKYEQYHHQQIKPDSSQMKSDSNLNFYLHEIISKDWFQFNKDFRQESSKQYYYYSLLENKHDYIQFMFPNHYKSRFNMDSVELSKFQAQHFSTNLYLGALMLKSIYIFFDFMGIFLNPTDFTIYIINEKRLQNVLFVNKHNHLRLRRILACLSVTGFRDIALKLIDFLEQNQTIKQISKYYQKQYNQYYYPKNQYSQYNQKSSWQLDLQQWTQYRKQDQALFFCKQFPSRHPICENGDKDIHPTKVSYNNTMQSRGGI